MKDDLTPTVLGEDQQYFVRCGRCNAAYSVTQDMIKPEGSRVKCEVCGHTWFQAANRLQVLGEGYILKVRLCPGHVCAVVMGVGLIAVGDGGIDQAVGTCRMMIGSMLMMLVGPDHAAGLPPGPEGQGDGQHQEQQAPDGHLLAEGGHLLLHRKPPLLGKSLPQCFGDMNSRPVCGC